MKNDFQEDLKRVEDRRAVRLFYPERCPQTNFDYETAEKILRERGYGKTIDELNRILG